jgi:hypothetical protein
MKSLMEELVCLRAGLDFTLHETVLLEKATLCLIVVEHSINISVAHFNDDAFF